MTEEQEKQGETPREKQGQESEKQAPTGPGAGNQGPTQTDGDAEDQEDGRTPPPDDLSEDPAYEPEDEALKDIKGG
jgi:hypothetical protein